MLQWISNYSVHGMNINFRFDHSMFQTLVGGVPALEIQTLNISNVEEARRFILTYGYDMNNEVHLDNLWKYYRRALNYLRTYLLRDDEQIPEMLSDPNQLKDLSYLLIYASTRNIQHNSVQGWACAILRVMHVLVHLENDLFAQFSKEIQEQILSPLQNYVHRDPVSGVWLGSSSDSDRIRLDKFVVKSFKSIDSAVNKLLAKPGAIAFTILDKLGARFVTRHLFDAFRVLRFLSDNNLVNFAHGISEEANNTLYPLNLFFETMETLSKENDSSLEEIDRRLAAKLEEPGRHAEYRKKLNMFSSGNYRFLKFITRRLIRIEISEAGKPRQLSFFYPYEIQILDYGTYLQNLSGPSAHDQYKLRQKEFARRRVLGFLEKSKNA